MPSGQRPFVPLWEVCFMLGVPYSRVYRQVLSGQVPAERHGSRWFVRREAFEGLRATHEAASREQAHEAASREQAQAVA